MNLTVGGSTETRTATASSGGTVTYSSSAETVAMVNASTGEVTPVGEGTCIITASVDATGSYSSCSSSYTVNVAAAGGASSFTWKLKIADYATATTDLVTWTATFASMTLAKNGSAQNANSYLGGSGTNTQTRFYTSQQITVTPATGYRISKVEFTCTTEEYGAGLYGNSWTNATATHDGGVVTVTPTLGTSAMSVIVSTAVHCTGVTVYYVATGELLTNDLSVTSPLNVTVGSSANISYSTSSTGAMTFTSNNISIATVNETGRVSGVAVGSTTISVSQASDGTYAASGTKTVTVNVSAASADNYVLVENEQTDWSGTYLMVYAEDPTDGDGVALDGSISSTTDINKTGNSIDVTIDSKKIAANSTTNPSSFTIAKSGDSYTILSNSGLYIGNDESGTNQIQASTETAYLNTISLNTDGDAQVEGAGGKHLGWNSASELFRYYTQESYKVYLYRKAKSSGEVTTATASFSPSAIEKQVGETWTKAVATNSTAAPVYSSSDETVVSVNPSTGEATALKVGRATITANVPANTDYTSASASYTVSVTKGESDLTLTSDATVTLPTSQTSYTITYSTSSTGALTWESSNSSIAIVDQGSGKTGVVTLTGTEGTVTITFRQAADDNYLASEDKTVTITVSSTGGSGSLTFTKVTSTAGLVVGKRYLLVYEDDSKALGSINSSSYGNPVDVTIDTSESPYTITLASEDAANILTLSNGTTTSNYAFKTGIEKKYLSWTSSNSLTTYDGSVPTTNSSWTLTYSSSVLTMSNVNTSERQLQYNSSSPRFACYTGTQKSVALYAEVETAPTKTSFYYRVSGGAIELGEDNWTSDDASKYLIVYEGRYRSGNSDEPNPRAYDGATGPGGSGDRLTGKTINVTITDDRIAASDVVNNATFAFSASGSGVQVKTKRGTYIGDADAAEEITNALKETSTSGSYVNTASITDGHFSLRGSGNAPGVGGVDVKRELRHNWLMFYEESSGSWVSQDNNMFRFYRDDSGVQTKLSLYRRVYSDEKYVQLLPCYHEMMVGDTWKPELVTQNTTGTPSYTSADPSIVTVDADGTVTAVAPGRADIYVTVDGVKNYANITVTAAEILSRYVRVTNTDDLRSGDYLIVYQTSTNATEGSAMNGNFDPVIINSSTMEANPIDAFSVSIEADKDDPTKRAIGATTSVNTKSFTVNYSYDTNAENYAHHVQSNSGYYFTKATAATGFQVNPGSAFANTLTANTTNATFKGTGASYLKYNSSTEKFQFYASGQQDIQLYKKEPYRYKVYAGSETPIATPLAYIDHVQELGNNQIAYYDIAETVAADAELMENITDVTNVAVNGTAYHLKISDKVDGVYTPFYAPAALTIATNLTYSRGNAGGWNSVCLPISIPFEKVEDMFGSGVEVWRLKGLDDNAQVEFVQLKSGETVPAGEPVLVNSDVTAWDIQKLAGPFDVNGVQGGEVTKAEKSSAIGTVALIGTYKQIVPGEVVGSELFKLTGDGTCFGKLSKTGKVFPFRMYLKFTPAEGMAVPAQLSLSLLEDDGDWTGIVVPKAKSDERWYDLSGRAVDYPISKGIYVRNGRKVVVK